MRVLENSKALAQGLMQYLAVEMRQKSNNVTTVLMKEISALFLSLVLNCPKMFWNTEKTSWCVFSSTQLTAWRTLHPKSCRFTARPWERKSRNEYRRAWNEWEEDLKWPWEPKLTLGCRLFFFFWGNLKEMPTLESGKIRKRGWKVFCGVGTNKYWFNRKI